MSSKLKCIAVDDEPLALRLLAEYAAQTPALEMVRTFEDALTAAEYLKTTTIDLLFIDINMPDITGIDLVRSLEIKPMIIFCTAYKKFAYDGFELDAVDYLLKPVDYPRFLKSVEKAVAQHNQRTAQTSTNESANIFVRSEYRMLKIGLDKIEYIEGLEDYIRIHIEGSKPVLTLMTLKSILEKLPPDFRRIHRSYIIPVNKIKSVLNKKVTLSTGKELPISDSYTTEVNEWMKKS